jgi:hypothetical protein
MAAVAEALRGGGGVVRELPGGAAAVSRAPAPEVEATAHFLAAIHNAHWGQAAPIVEYHLARSLRLAPRMAGVMTAFLEMQGRACPPSMTPAAARLLDCGDAVLRRFILRYLIDLINVDELLIDAIVRCLRDVGVVEASSLVAEIRTSEWSPAPGRPVDLLAEARCPSFACNGWPEDKRATFRANQPTSTFSLALAAAVPLVLTLTARSSRFSLPREPGRCVVELNDVVVGSFALRSCWATHSIRVPHEAARTGANAIRITWPATTAQGDQALRHCAAELEAGRLANFSPAFGELFALHAALETPG